jgi:hypothetical protein
MRLNRVDGILLLYNTGGFPIASNVSEHIGAFRKNSRFSVWEVDTSIGFPKVLWEYEFGVIVLHYSLFGWLPFYLDDEFLEYLRGSEKSYKVAFFQDEYRYWPERADLLNRYKVDCVYTCIEPEYFEETYWRYTKVPRLINYIPGYVSDDMVRWAGEATKPDEEREIDIGYRGRQSYHYMGRAAREKHEIGTRFLELGSRLGLKMDIASEEHKRIYGKQWVEFLGNCRATLGVEAGVSIFDIDNLIIPQYQQMTAEKPDIGFEEVYDKLLFRYDGRGVFYRTISPRVFEAAAARTCQILFEGRYSGILKPMVHYIPLKKDFSNFDEVIGIYGDVSFRRELTDNAYRDLIASGKYSYREFIREFDEEIKNAGLESGVTAEVKGHLAEVLYEDEKSLFMKKIEMQQSKYLELLNKHVSLQGQFMAQQRELQEAIQRGVGDLKNEAKGVFSNSHNRIHRFVRKILTSLVN